MPYAWSGIDASASVSVKSQRVKKARDKPRVLSTRFLQIFAVTERARIGLGERVAFKGGRAWGMGLSPCRFSAGAHC